MSEGSGGPPVLWLSTNAVQLTVLVGDDGQLMSTEAPVAPVARPSYGLVQMQFNLFFACGAPVFVLLLHLFLSFVKLFRSSFPLPRHCRSSFVPLFSSSDFSSFPLFRLLRSYFVPLFRFSFCCHFWDGGLLLKQCYVYYLLQLLFYFFI